jgi:hypothetical protein
VRVSNDGIVYVADRMNNRMQVSRQGASAASAATRESSSSCTTSVDSKGNVYTAEVGNGRRVQKFLFGR